MNFSLSLSFNIREIIYGFLIFPEIKSLLFLNWKLFQEVLIYLREKHLKIKQNDIFRFDRSTLFTFFQKFPNITQLQLNCQRIDVLYIIPALSKNLKSLKLVDVNLSDLTTNLFWELLSNGCNALEFFSISEGYNDYHFNNIRDKQYDNIVNLKDFFNCHQALKKFSLKFNKHHEKTSFSLTSANFFESALQALAIVQNNVEILIFHNIRIPASFLPVGNLFSKMTCPKVKELKVKSQISFKEPHLGINRESLGFLYEVFPNLEKIHFFDCFPPNLNLNNAFQNLTSSCLNNQTKSPPTTIKRFYLNCYGSPIEIDEILMMNLLSNCSDLISFGCASNKSMSNGIVQELVFRNPNLLELNFDYTNFDDLACSILASSNIMNNLTKISLQFCKRITHEGFATLLEGCKSLKSFNVKGNKNFKNKTVDFLLQSGEIEELYLHENRIKNSSLQKIAKRFQKTLKIIEISKLEGYEKFTNSVFKELFDEKFKLSRVKHLDMAFNHIIDFSSLKVLCFVFPNLEVFNVKCCGHFNLECFDHIVNSNWMFTLEKLNIKYCNLFPDQIETIIKKLNHFKRLVYIYTEDCTKDIFNERFIFTP